MATTRVKTETMELILTIKTARQPYVKKECYLIHNCKGLPIILTCIALLSNGLFARGSAICNNKDIEILKEKELKGIFLKAALIKRGQDISYGRMKKAVELQKTSDSITRFSVLEKVIASHAVSAFTEKRDKLWKSGYNVSPTFFELCDLHLDVELKKG